MIAVDTSVWVAALRDSSNHEAAVLDKALDEDRVALLAPVKIEILAGAGSDDRQRLHRLLSALPVFYPVEQTWRTIESWIDIAAKQGHRFGFADLLIGAITADNGYQLWSLDSDFRRMSEVGLIDLYTPSK